MSSSITSYSMNDDMASIYDVIDLTIEDSGRLTSMSSNSSSNNYKQSKYRISLHSINDDELKLFHRDLVTPAASICGDALLPLRHNLYNGNNTHRRHIMRPTSRTESVMLFKKINNGDEDVTSFDLVSSELRDFIIDDENDFILEEDEEENWPKQQEQQQQKRLGVNRATISNNASKSQEINKFRYTLLHYQKQQRKKDDSKLPTHTRLNCNATALKKITSPNTDRHQRLATSTAAAKSRDNTNDIKTIAVPPLAKDQNRVSQPPLQRSSIALPSSNTKSLKFNKDEHLYKQIPKRLITNCTTNNNNPLVVTPSTKQKQPSSSPPSSLITKKSTKRQQSQYQQQSHQEQSTCNHNVSLVKRNLLLQEKKKQQQSITIIPGVKEKDSFGHANHTITSTTISRSYRGVKNEQIPERKLAMTDMTPRATRKQQPSFGLVRGAAAYDSRIDRNRSDTTSSSSSEELLEEEYAYSGLVNSSKVYHSKRKDEFSEEPFIATSHHDHYRHQISQLPQRRQQHIERAGGYFQYHRYSVPNSSSSLLYENGDSNNDHYYRNNSSSKSLSSSSRIKSMSSNKISTPTDNMSVTDSAKQVLACIRERRKSSSAAAMMMDSCSSGNSNFKRSPKLDDRATTTTTTTTTARYICQQKTQQPPAPVEEILSASDFRSRLQYQQQTFNSNNNQRDFVNTEHSNDYSIKYNTTTAKRYDEFMQQKQYYEENDYNYNNDDNANMAGSRLLFTSSRLPQRTIYR